MALTRVDAVAQWMRDGDCVGAPRHHRQMKERESRVTPTARHVIEVRRFTREDFERELTFGWDLYGGRYQRMSGLEWAWFRRDVKEEESDASE